IEQMTMRRRPSGIRGFSLLEVMIAMAVIAIAIFAIMSMIMTTMANNEATREVQLAKEAAASKIEEFKARGFAALSAAYPSSSTPTVLSYTVSSLTSQTTSQPGAPLTVRIDSSNSEVYDILATVDWKGRKGKGTYSMRSLCAR